MPYVRVYIDTSDVADELDDDELKRELEKRGYQVSEKGKSVASLDGLARVEHLALCGLVRDAQAEALQLVGDAIGRRIH